MISTSNNSNWLDRLRSTRGFPTGSEPDLDRFLSSSSSSGSAPTPNESTTRSESTHSESTRSLHLQPPQEQGEEFFNGVLCHLFNMASSTEDGECSRSLSVKTSRKQPNPRFFKASLSSNMEEQQLGQQQFSMVAPKDGGVMNKGEGNDEKEELKGYSKSEVTIIDTSFDIWKCDKWVFRKNDEWKVRDKRGKCKSSGKKRKMVVGKLGNGNGNGNDNGDDDDDKLKVMMKKNKKKMKREVENLLMHQNNEQPQNDKEEPSKEREDVLSKLPLKRFPCPRPPKKVRNESSTVVLLQSIPPNNVNTPIKPVQIFQKRRPKQMKLV